MSTTRAFILTVCFAWLFGGVAVAQGTSGINDLVVYDSGLHDRDLPRVQFEDVPGGTTVEVVPAVHVHRYYYSGDKDFQGPIIKGGPTMLVADHPGTGEKLYIDVNLPAGAPRIVYTSSCISYVYPQSRVVVSFPRFAKQKNKAVVRYGNGKGQIRTVRDAASSIAERTRNSVQNNVVVQTGTDLASETVKLGRGIHAAASEGVAVALDGAMSLGDMIPGVVPLKSYAEERRTNDRRAEMRRAVREADAETNQFLPTVR